MHNRGHQLVAFPAMIFVGASWGANVPVSKVMLAHFDLIPMSAIRTAVAGAALGLLLLLVEGAKALRIDLDFRRFALLGLMMGGFFAVYTLGLQFSNPITAAAVAVAGPLVSAVTVRLVTGLRFDPGFPVALALTLLGGAILVSSTLVGSGSVTFGGGEIVVLLSNSIWTLYSIKAQAWFDRASQLHRAYVASLSAFGWTTLLSVVLIALGWSRSPLMVSDGWVWTQLLGIALLASGARRLFLEHRRQPARRGGGVAVGQSGAVFRRIVVNGLWFRAQCLPDRGRPRGAERRGLHAMAQAADGAPMSVAGLKTRNCRWIDVRGAVDQRGRINFLEAGKDLPFQPQRLFWLHHIAPGQWRGRHGHRKSQLVFVAMNGGCRVHLDDAKVKESVTLDDPARALYVGTWVWHELTDFSAGAAILVIASTLYEDAEYLRDYDAFKREAASRS